LLNENAYGVRKRLLFIAETIELARPQSVLDIGCGSGQLVTIPLAAKYPAVNFVGADSDRKSIEAARRCPATRNVRFLMAEELGANERYDLIIASEVIEHVETPKEFLEDLGRRLKPDGRIILTLPNGYGPFEIASLVEGCLKLSGILRAVRSVKRLLWGYPGRIADLVDSYAVSPHVNFFSLGSIRSVIAASTLREVKFRPRTWLCGLGFDHLIRGERLTNWNADIADKLPPWLASDWMFVLEPAGLRVEYLYQRGLYAKLRRYLNQNTWGLR